MRMLNYKYSEETEKKKKKQNSGLSLYVSFYFRSQRIFAAFPFYLQEIEFDGITREVIKCKCDFNDLECPAFGGFSFL